MRGAGCAARLIPEIRGYRFGPDAGLGQGNVDFAIVAEFDSAEGYRVYAAHPAHRQVIERLVQPIRDARFGVQFHA